MVSGFYPAGKEPAKCWHHSHDDDLDKAGVGGLYHRGWEQRPDFLQLFKYRVAFALLFGIDRCSFDDIPSMPAGYSSSFKRHTRALDLSETLKQALSVPEAAFSHRSREAFISVYLL